MKYKKYMKKLTPQELGYRKGRLKTGQYFYISKQAVGTFFEELSRETLNDSRRLVFDDPLEPGNLIEASYVYHNDQFVVPNGTRNEYRIYLNRDIAKHDLHFEPNDIVLMEWVNTDKLKLTHFKPRSEGYSELEQSITESKIRGAHALLI
jgi:hypothetical protein